MTHPFEDPRKTEMRGRCEVAIDHASHESVDDVVSIGLPVESGLNGAIRGDLQSLDGEGVRYAYYLRPESNRPLPQWLGNLARATHQMDGVRLYVVVSDVSAVMERSCRAAGAGLLRLTAENIFEHIVDPSEFDPSKLRAEFRNRVSDLRRRLETKLDLNLRSIEQRFARVDELTQGMSSEIRDKYIAECEEADYRWRGWGEDMSTRLDEALEAQDDDELKAIERELVRGAAEDEDEDVDSEGAP